MLNWLVWCVIQIHKGQGRKCWEVHYLRHFAFKIWKTVRKKDCVGRKGGGKFSCRLGLRPLHHWEAGT